MTEALIGRPPRPHLFKLTSTFYNNIAIGDPEACWMWTGRQTPSGYGISIREVKGTRIAHRISYALCVGDLVPGMQIDHLCCMPLCVNPRHLEQVTPAENMYRRRRTHCKHGHEYAVVGMTVTYRPNGFIRSKACNECRRIWGRTHPRKRRQKNITERQVI